MVFALRSWSFSTDSDTESVAEIQTGFCGILPRMVFAGPSSLASTDSGTNSGGMEEKPVLTLGLNSDPVSSLKVYTLKELKSATRNFWPDTLLAESGFARVFKGWMDERNLAPCKVGSGIPVVIKKFKLDQRLCEWQSEVTFFCKFSHPNLVRLLGYCWEDNQYLLVYEYMQRGSLEDHLFRRGAEPLPWDVRLKIAIGAARGLDFLHTSKKNVIYRDFNSSNILLDADYNAKLSDFWRAEPRPASMNLHLTMRIVETYAYTIHPNKIFSEDFQRTIGTSCHTAPEYFHTGHLYVKSDVYGFGVVLLEMLTGLQLLNPTHDRNLVEWARPSLHDERKLRKMMDPRLEGQYPLKAATRAAELILKCLEGDPEARPSMDEVLVTLENINTIRKKKKETKASASSRPSSHQHHHNHHRSPIRHNHSANAPQGSESQNPPSSAASRTH